MAELKTSIAVCRSFIDECIAQHNIGCLDNSTASMAKVHFPRRMFFDLDFHHLKVVDYHSPS